MCTKSRNNIKIQTNPILERNSLNIQPITYNKPLFINMINESNNKYKTSTLSTKINTTNGESIFTGSNNKNKLNCNISVKEFDIGKNYYKTTDNFFVKDINMTLSSNEENNEDNYETFTPGKGALFLKDEEEQFTPYLGQKNNENIIGYKNNNKENKNYSNIFNNSKEIITRSSLNLKNHLDKKLSNNSKSINTYQKLSFYQKNIKKGFKTSNIYINKNKYNFDENPNISKKYNNHKEINKKVILIQSIFRGYIYRIKLYDQLKNYTCITVFCQILKNILSRRKKYIFNGWIYLIQRNKLMQKKLLKKSNRISLFIRGNNNISNQKINYLIEQNNNLKIKLSEFVINNTRLKKEINKYKDLEIKYQNLLIQFDKYKNFNNSIINERNKFLKELNSIKEKIKMEKYLTKQNIINFNIKNDYEKVKNNNQKIEICKQINNISILNNNENNKSTNNYLNEKNANITDNSKILNDIKDLDLFKNDDKKDNKNYRLIIVKKINFVIKKMPKEENSFKDDKNDKNS